MPSRLNSKQWRVLSESFGLIDARERTLNNSIWLPELLDYEQCERFIYKLTPIINSPSIKVTASLLSKRYAFLAVTSSLYSMSVYNSRIDMSAQNCFLDYSYENYLWRSKMPIQILEISNPDNEEHRLLWRDNLIRTLFAKNLGLLWDVMIEVTKIHPRILWENTAVRVYSLYENKLKSSCPIIRKRAMEDFNYLLNLAPPELFGIDYNPLKRYNYPRIEVSTQNSSIRYRKSCCFYYKATEPKEYCSNCPLLKSKT